MTHGPPARPKSQPRLPRRPVRWRAGAAAGAGLLALTSACSSGGEATTAAPTTKLGTTTTTAPALAGPAEPASPSGPGTMLYWLRGGKVAASRRGVDLAGDPEGALRLLFAGPTGWEADAGLTTGIQSNATLRSFRLEGDTAVVDVSRTFEVRDTRLPVGQVVYTLTSYPGIGQVRFLVDGVDNGATGVAPVGRADLGPVTPELLLDGPTPFAPVSSPLQLSGTLDAAQDGYRYSVQGADGTTLAEGTFAVRFGTGPRRSFDNLVVLSGAPAGTATVTVSTGGAPPIQLPVTLR